jgi:WD40 repeat protein
LVHEQECTLSVHFILLIVLSLISHIYIPGVQIRTIGHTGEGTCICARDEDGDLEIDDACPVRGHSAIVNSVAYSPDGKHIASASRDKTVKNWDSTTGEEVSVLVCHRLSFAAAWSVLTSVFGR